MWVAVVHNISPYPFRSLKAVTLGNYPAFSLPYNNRLSRPLGQYVLFELTVPRLQAYAHEL
jgi:hypothetical protein